MSVDRFPLEALKENLTCISLLVSGKGFDTWLSLVRPNQSILKEISPECHWKDWCWSWNSNTLATWCKEVTHLKRSWCWEALGAGGEGDDRGWDGWMASPTRWTWVWVNSGRWWWTGRPGMLWFMVLQIVGHDWVTELNRTERDTEVTYSWSPFLTTGPIREVPGNSF